MYQAIVFLPLVGFLVAGLFGRFIGARASEIITTSLLFVTAALSWVAFVTVGFGTETFYVPIARWITSGTLIVDWALRIDTLTVVMLVVVNSVSALVHLYSIGYMHEDPDRPRFFAYLSLFTFAMLTLVTADNLVQMFFGWEGVGLASYLLIGFWYEKPSACAAAMKAFIVNRVGDFGFMLGLLLTFIVFGSVSFGDIFSRTAEFQDATFNFIGFEWHTLTLISLLLFIGAMGKSAQFILHTWLPDAMEGPTPVSALIHAATMVTAGVFMVTRMSPVFEYAPSASTVIIVIGAVTAFFAATIGLVQNDIKRVIAYSTCSQLGYMFVALGVGAYSAGVFHLFTHAFFKALLFLGAGSVIHAMHHEQDMRKMGGLRKYIPFTALAMTIGTLALTGFPFTSGFYSKDAIIESAFASHSSVAGFAFTSTIVAALMTSFYSWRLYFMTFEGKPRWEHHDDHAHGHDHAHDDGHDHKPHESPLVMLLPLVVLSIGALFAGAVFYNAFIGSGYDAFWKGAIFTNPDNHILHDMHEVPLWVKLAPVVTMVIGFLLALWFYVLDTSKPRQLAAAFPGVYRFLLNKWYIDELYNFLFVRPAKELGRFFWKQGDGWLIDGHGPDGISARVLDVTGRVVKLQTGYVYHYAFAMLIGVAAFVTWYIFGGAV
ncbi:NADH-quinone oxidoreductase subunit L [Pseudochelatococcus contaminans]|uniref:NADH-quinone oxidoreductase subunit L n=1 Tax=Pseudochelatococcus contaminans TaxID=1538103 RepID=A0A7W5Z247_9HYPH|nr:NADH-quinone oxidoreductase subunit L [Pseudochelatococcus contaminans]MBB3808470.1 NADH-quinone oxidoreductase subunit L [Pseudochelatococcus contaminans]